MYAMSDTADTSHFDRSWLKAEAFQNIIPISVTCETSQSAIGPRADPSSQSPIGDSLIHILTAAWSFSLDFGLNAPVAGVSEYDGDWD